MDSSDNNSLKQLYEAQSSAEAFQAEDVDDDDREHGEEDRAKEAVDDAEDDEWGEGRVERREQPRHATRRHQQRRQQGAGDDVLTADEGEDTVTKYELKNKR